LVAADGGTQLLDAEDFEIAVADTWTSPNSGAQYPARWTVHIPDADLTLEITPYIADQEMQVSFVYWEGAVQVFGQVGGAPVSGQGYVELTGYAASMEGEF
jgi:predicted secreted hydrolase